MKRILISLSCCVFLTPAFAIDVKFDDGYPQTPKCKSVSDGKIWQTNFESCMKPLREGVRRKDATVEEITDMCKCVADGLINDQTCAQLDQAKSDKEYGDKLTSSVVKHCKMAWEKSGHAKPK